MHAIMLEQKGVFIKVFKVIIKKLYLYINIYISPFFNHFAKLRTFLSVKKRQFLPRSQEYNQTHFFEFQFSAHLKIMEKNRKNSGFWLSHNIQ